jgi:hypothetical protein
LKVKRVATIPTFEKYKKDLSALIPKYLKKSGCHDTEEDILQSIKLGCNNPHYNCCVLVEKKPISEHGSMEVLKGFIIAYVWVDHKGKKITVDHLYAPNMGLAGKVFSLVVDKLCEDFNVDNENIWFMTYRNPEAWIRFADKEGYPMNLQAWVLRRERRRRY